LKPFETQCLLSKERVPLYCMKNVAAISTKARGDLLLFSAYFKWPKRGSWIRIRKGIPSSTELCNVNSMLASFPPGMLKTCHENVSARWVRVWVCVRTCVSVRVCVCVSHAFGQTQSDPSRCSTPFLRTHPKTVVLPQSHPFTLSSDTPRDEQYPCRTQLSWRIIRVHIILSPPK
jgi:hypothetical protein